MRSRLTYRVNDSGVLETSQNLSSQWNQVINSLQGYDPVAVRPPQKPVSLQAVDGARRSEACSYGMCAQRAMELSQVDRFALQRLRTNDLLQGGNLSFLSSEP